MNKFLNSFSNLLLKMFIRGKKSIFIYVLTYYIEKYTMNIQLINLKLRV